MRGIPSCCGKRERGSWRFLRGGRGKMQPLRCTAEEQIKKPRGLATPGLLRLKPGGDLLWHARGAHYHRRRAFSLPSSEWDRVVPTRYGRQTNCLRFMEP